MSDTSMESSRAVRFLGDVLADDPGELFSPHDYAARRRGIFEGVLDAVGKRFPISNGRHTLEASDLGYDSLDDFTPAECKKAMLEGATLSRKLRGRLILRDNATGAVVDKTGKRALINVPYLTDRGTFVRNGVEIALSNQFRLLPGVFTHRTRDGRVESHVNVKHGTGSAFKVSMDPATARFEILAGGRKTPLYPVMSAMGVPDSLLEEAWGGDILARNKEKVNTQAVRKTFANLAPRNVLIDTLNNPADNPWLKSAAEAQMPTGEGKAAEGLAGVMRGMELDPSITKITLGTAHSFVTPALFLDATAKMLKVSRGEVDGDDRDSMEFQRVYGAADYMRERIMKDPGRVMRGALWKATNSGSLSKVPSGFLNKHVDGLFLNSGLAQMVEAINPLDAYDQAYRVTRMGEGGIPSEQAIPDASRAVQPSYLGYVDPVRSTENAKVGVDLRLAHGAMLGRDGKIYRGMEDARTGKVKMVDSATAARSVVGMPEGRHSTDRFVPAMVPGRGLSHVARSKVDYFIKDPSDMFNTLSNATPLLSGVKGMRLLMGAKFKSAALPLADGEAPLVDSAIPGAPDMSSWMGGALGNVRAQSGGVVRAVSRDKIRVEGPDGKVLDHHLYDNFPGARKTYVRNIPVVKPGDPVKPGALLARSNFTDGDGRASMGLNLRAAFMNFKGQQYEDAITVSESAARRLTSEHMYKSRLREGDGVEAGKGTYVNMFPGKFTEAQFKNIGPDGVVKAGTVVRAGDPLILAVRRRQPRPGSLGRRTTTDHAVTWDRSDAGVVTDVAKTRDGWSVYVRENSPLREGDKLASAHGMKGVVSRVLPDAEMPRDEQGRPLEMLLNPLSIVSRTNSAMLVAAALGKVAAKTGRRYVLPPFSMDGSSMAEFALAELAKNKMSDVEKVHDPSMDRDIPGIFTGVVHIHKLQHTAEDKGGGRAFGGYTLDDTPSTGGAEGGKHIGNMELGALVSHGARELLLDSKLVRGQKNDDYWRDLKLGRTPSRPRGSFMFDKFLASVKGAGVNVTEDKGRYNIFAMTGAEAGKLCGDREIKTADTYDPVHFHPVKGGLFDEGLTGGADGNLFSYIKLDEPVLNPVMEDPVRRILGLTRAQLSDLESGASEYRGLRGGRALKARLDDVDLNDVIRKALSDFKGGRGSKRDDAAKRLRAASAVKERGLRLSDLMWDRVPVVPPRFRPVVAAGDMNMASDFNYLYRDLIFSRNDLRDAAKVLPEDQLSDSRAAVKRAVKAVAGLGDPDNRELKEKGVEGLMAHIFGKRGSKWGMFNRRLLGGAMDLSTRAVITNDPSLRLDQVGLPENRAWDLYEPFVVRRLVRSGMPAVEAARSVARRGPDALRALREEVLERPVLINRAPTMHKYGFMGAWPVLVKGDTLRVSSHIMAPMGADIDGNCVDYDTPVFCTLLKSALDKNCLEWYCRLLTHGGVGMLTKDMETVVGLAGKLFKLRIGEFPVFGEPLKDRNGADVYNVPPGVLVESYDSTSMRRVMSPVTLFTVERDCPTRKVSLDGGAEVVVSANESLCVFDHTTGGIVKKAPDEAVGYYCPVLTRDRVGGGRGNKDLGWWIGAFLSDGWCSVRMVGYAKLEKIKRDAFERIARAEITPNFTRYEYAGPGGADKLGDSVKIHLSGKEFYDKVSAMGMSEENPEGSRQSLTKKIPEWVFTEGSRDLMLGVMAGLLDGDGGIGVGMTTGRPRYMAKLNTSSPGLRDTFCQLCSMLGLRYSVTVCPPRGHSKEHYVINISQKDFPNVARELPLIGEKETRAVGEMLSTWRESKWSPTLVPITFQEKEALSRICLSDKDPNYYSTRRSKSNPAVPLAMLRKFSDKYPELFRDIFKNRLDSGVVWAVVKASVDAGKRDVFDFEVPATKVFAVANGLVVWDTMTMHVPVAPEAVEEVKAKMMPGRHLFGARDFKLLYAPRMEYVQGAHIATRNPKKGLPHVFETEADAIRAYSSGRIDADDPVKIKRRDLPRG